MSQRRWFSVTVSRTFSAVRFRKFLAFGALASLFIASASWADSTTDATTLQSGGPLSCGKLAARSSKQAMPQFAGLTAEEVQFIGFSECLKTAWKRAGESVNQTVGMVNEAITWAKNNMETVLLFCLNPASAIYNWCTSESAEEGLKKTASFLYQFGTDSAFRQNMLNRATGEVSQILAAMGSLISELSTDDVLSMLCSLAGEYGLDFVVGLVTGGTSALAKKAIEATKSAKDLTYLLKFIQFAERYLVTKKEYLTAPMRRGIIQCLTT